MFLFICSMLILSMSNLNSNQVIGGELKKLSVGKYYKPGRSCGVLNKITFLNEMPKDGNEIQQCTVIDLNSKHRETDSMETESTSTTTTTSSTACDRDSCPYVIPDGFCDDECNCIEHNFDGGDCCGPNVDTSVCNECECKEIIKT